MKKFLHILLFSSVALLFNGCISGWGWLVPYNLQPSYHKFKKMCKLNELPNTEEKYNKILGYFDLSLDTLDWEELNKTKRLFKHILDVSSTTSNRKAEKILKDEGIVVGKSAIALLLAENKSN